MKPAGREIASVSSNKETNGVFYAPTPIDGVSSRAQSKSQVLGQALSGMYFWGGNWWHQSVQIIVQ